MCGCQERAKRLAKAIVAGERECVSSLNSMFSDEAKVSKKLVAAVLEVQGFVMKLVQYFTMRLPPPPVTGGDKLIELINECGSILNTLAGGGAQVAKESTCKFLMENGVAEACITVLRHCSNGEYEPFQDEVNAYMVGTAAHCLSRLAKASSELRHAVSGVAGVVQSLLLQLRRYHATELNAGHTCIVAMALNNVAGRGASMHACQQIVDSMDQMVAVLEYAAKDLSNFHGQSTASYILGAIHSAVERLERGPSVHNKLQLLCRSKGSRQAIANAWGPVWHVRGVMNLAAMTALNLVDQIVHWGYEEASEESRELVQCLLHTRPRGGGQSILEITIILDKQCASATDSSEEPKLAPRMGQQIITCLCHYGDTMLDILSHTSASLQTNIDGTVDAAWVPESCSTTANLTAQMDLSWALDKRRCSNDICCNLALEGTSFNKCGNCRKVYYCSRECQKADWKQHKHVCKAPAAPHLHSK